MGASIVRVRIRGIYATALTKLFLDSGFQVVQASKIISERFRIPQLTAPADVTVKDGDEPSELLVIGYPSHVDKTVAVLRERLPYSFYWESKLPLHSTVLVEVTGHRDNKCFGRVDDVEVELVDYGEACEQGMKLIASVVRTAVKKNETPRVRPGARIVGDYAIVFECDNPGTTFSEHIRSLERRAELMAAATRVLEKYKVCIHWRSSAQYGDVDQLQHHIEELAEELQKIREKVELEKVVGGEKIVVVALSAPDKEELDRLRAAVVPTTALHHSIKSLSPEYQEIVDLLDVVAKHVGQKSLRKPVLEYIASKVKGRRIRIEHVKLSGETIILGEAQVVDAYLEDDQLKLVLRRIVRSEGVYDGLNVEKEPGDTIETKVSTGEWRIIHHYYSPTGELKGVYVNINTPPEIAPTRIRYLDLAVDIVKTPNGEAKVIDLEELIEARKKGVITEKAYAKALEEVEKTVGREKLEKTLEQVLGQKQSP